LPFLNEADIAQSVQAGNAFFMRLPRGPEKSAKRQPGTCERFYALVSFGRISAGAKAFGYHPRHQNMVDPSGHEPRRDLTQATDPIFFGQLSMRPILGLGPRNRLAPLTGYLGLLPNGLTRRSSCHSGKSFEANNDRAHSPLLQIVGPFQPPMQTVGCGGWHAWSEYDVRRAQFVKRSCSKDQGRPRRWLCGRCYEGAASLHGSRPRLAPALPLACPDLSPLRPTPLVAGCGILAQQQ